MIKRSIILIMLLSVLLSLVSCNDNKGKETINMVNNIDEKQIMIGIWEGPRKHAMLTQEQANARYGQIIEAGFNMVFLFAELSDDEWLEKALKAAEYNDIKLIIDLGAVYSNKQRFFETIDKVKDSNVVIGYNIIDEPNHNLFGFLGSIANKLREYVGPNKLIFCNLLPNYGPDSMLAQTIAEDSSAYQAYLESYIEKVKTDLLYFDYYPYTTSKESDEGMIARMLTNLSDIRNAGAKNGIQTGGFLQSSRWGDYKDGVWYGTRIPDQTEYKFLMHIHLLFGCKSLSNFLYWSRDGSDPDQRVKGYFEGLVTYQGEETDLYDIVKKQNQDLHAMKGIYLDYKHEAFIAKNLKDVYTKAISKELLQDSYKELIDIKSGAEILVGCFQKEGNTGLYVMNFNYRQGEKSKLSLILTEEKDYRVWGYDGLMQEGRSNKISFSLLPADAFFVEIY